MQTHQARTSEAEASEREEPGVRESRGRSPRRAPASYSLRRSRGRSKRVLGVLVTALLLAVGVSPAEARTLAEARKAGVLRLGFRTDARPFSYRDETGRAAGYAVEICREIAAAAQLPVEMVRVDSGNRFRAVKYDEVDLLCGSATANLSRREDVSFSTPIFAGGIGALMRTDAPDELRILLAGGPDPSRPGWRVERNEALKRRVFAVHASTTAETWLKTSLAELQVIARVDLIDQYADGVERVVKGKADVLFGERGILLGTAVRNENAGRLMVAGRHFTTEPLALVMQRGAEDLRLLTDRTLSRLLSSGRLSAIYTTHFGAPGEDSLQYLRWTTLQE